MVLTVEDGTGLAAADSLISLAYATTYHDERGNTAWAAANSTPELQEEALRRASFFLTNSYRWKGYPTNGRTQALAWPRYYVEDQYGYTIDSDEIPREVQQAVAEVALRELASPGALTPDYTPSERQESVKVGPIEVKYDLSRADAEAARPILLIVRDLIGALLATSGSRISGRTART